MNELLHRAATDNGVRAYYRDHNNDRWAARRAAVCAVAVRMTPMEDAA